MTIAARGIVYSGSDDRSRQSCAFPGICVMPGGRWLCTFRAAPSKSATVGQHVLLTISDDQGQSWSEPVAPFTPPALDDRPGWFRVAYLTAIEGGRVRAVLCWVDASNPSLPFFNEATEGLLDTRIFLTGSEDGGDTWSAPRLMDTSPFDMPTPLTGPMLLLPNQELTCQFELAKPYNDESEWRHASVLMFSFDGGASWPEHTVVSSDSENRVFYWDQRPGVLDDGRLLDLFWTYDKTAAAYLNIHARDSSDNGRHLSAIWDTGVAGQPAPPVSLADGRIGMVYVDRTGPPAIKMRVSDDHGRSWPEETQVVIHESATPSQTDADKGTMQDAWTEMGKFSVGLPATSLLSNGDVLVVFYAGPQTDETAIHWARVQAK